MKQWEETIEELKREPLSEGVRDYLRKFFIKPAALPPSAPRVPASSVPPDPVVSQKFIEELNTILDRHQFALNSYIKTIKIKSIKRELSKFNFRSIPEKLKRTKQLDSKPLNIPGTPPAFTGPPAAKTPFTPIPRAPATPVKIKKKKDLPPNSIFNEAKAREWTPRITGLEKVLNDAHKEILDFILKIATTSGYTPKKPNDIQSLIAEMKHFTILDKRSLQILRIKLIAFLIIWRNLDSYLKFFKRSQQAQQRAEKKAEKDHIP